MILIEVFKCETEFLLLQTTFHFCKISESFCRFNSDPGQEKLDSFRRVRLQPSVHKEASLNDFAYNFCARAETVQ